MPEKGLPIFFAMSAEGDPYVKNNAHSAGWPMYG